MKGRKLFVEEGGRDQIWGWELAKEGCRRPKQLHSIVEGGSDHRKFVETKLKGGGWG